MVDRKVHKVINAFVRKSDKTDSRRLGMVTAEGDTITSGAITVPMWKEVSALLLRAHDEEYTIRDLLDEGEAALGKHGESLTGAKAAVRCEVL